MPIDSSLVNAFRGFSLPQIDRARQQNALGNLDLQQQQQKVAGMMDPNASPETLARSGNVDVANALTNQQQAKQQNAAKYLGMRLSLVRGVEDMKQLTADPSFGAAAEAVGMPHPKQIDNFAGVTDEQIVQQARSLAQALGVPNAAQDNVQSTQILSNGNLGLVFRNGQVKDTGQGVRPQNFMSTTFQLPDGTTVQGLVDPTTGAGYDMQGKQISPPVRGTSAPGGGSGAPPGAIPQPGARPQAALSQPGLGRGRSPEAQAAAVKAAEQGVADATTAKTREDARNEVASTANDLLQMPGLASAFGFVQGALPSMSGDVTDARAVKDKLTGLLSLENRGKMKGQGQISDFEGKLLGQSATVLTNPRISDSLAKKEIAKIAGILSGTYATVQNDAEYDALASGTQFIGPDGKVRTKP